MSTSRYIDINSSFRNRLVYPNISDFVVEVNTLSQSSPDAAQDPVLQSFPYETSTTQAGSTFTNIVLNSSSSNVLNFYRGSILEIGGVFTTITSYDPTTKIAIVSPAFGVAPGAGVTYTIRYELPILVSTTSAAATTQNTIVLNLGASSKDDFYVNNWVFVPGASPPTSYQWFRIKAYNGTTKVATIDGNFSAIIGAGVTFQILRFSFDNVRSLKYFGTEVGTNNPVCTNIRLVNLIVPNLPILNGYGGVLHNYPFVYVCLYSEKGITYVNPLISNSPASNKAIFKVPISSLFSTVQTFLTFSYTGMTQTISFKVNDDLRMQVLLPNGEFLQYDTGLSPSFPIDYPIISNPITQIQAVFEVSRTSN
jgi:hypothetical protein